MIEHTENHTTKATKPLGLLHRPRGATPKRKKAFVLVAAAAAAVFAHCVVPIL